MFWRGEGGGGGGGPGDGLAFHPGSSIHAPCRLVLQKQQQL